MNKTDNVDSIYHAQQVVLPIVARHVGKFSIRTTLPKECYLLAHDMECEEPIISLGGEEIPLLANDVSMYIGQPIALIIAPSVWQAHLFRQELHIDYEGKSRLYMPNQHAPTKKDAPVLRSPNYVMRNVKKGFDLEYVFSSAYQTFAQKYHMEHSVISAHDDMGAYACFDNNGKIIVYIASTWSEFIKSSLLRLFHLDADDLEIRLTGRLDSEDWMGVHAHLASCYVVWALRTTGKASRLVLSGRRPFFTANLGGDLQLELGAALDKDGKILAIHGRAVFDVGAYAISLNEVVDRMVWALGIRYKKVAFVMEIVAHLTYEEPALPEISFGVGPINYALEHFISVIKQQSSHISIRDWISLLYGKGDIDVYSHEWKHDTSYVALIKRLYSISQYARKYDAYYQEALSREQTMSDRMLQPYRGIGMALGELPNGFLRHYYAGTTVELTLLSHHKVVVRINSTSRSGSLYRYWQKMIASILGIRDHHVELVVATTIAGQRDQDSKGMVGSLLGTNVFHVTMLLQEACEDLQKRRFREHLPICVIASDKRYRRWKESQFEGDLSDRMSRIAMASEVEVDVQTLNIYIKSLYIVIDAGKIIQPEQVINHIRLEVDNSLKYLSNLHNHHVDARDYPDEILYRTALNPQNIVIDFLEKRHNNTKSRGISGLVQTVLPVSHLKAISLALQSPVSHLSLQNEAIYLQNQWMDILHQVQKKKHNKKSDEE